MPKKERITYKKKMVCEVCKRTIFVKNFNQKYCKECAYRGKRKK